MTKSVLFVCNLNSVRSPMAAALLRAAAGPRIRVDSAGVYEGGPDPFIETVLGEVGASLKDHEPKPVSAIDLAGFDLLIALTPEAAAELRRAAPREKIEFWDTENPSEARGGRDAALAAYRSVRDELARRLAARFPDLYRPT
jgi:protein-tyrosine-phosphatase